MQSYSTITSSPHSSAPPPPAAVSTNPDSSHIINYQYNYNCSYGGIGDDFQHKQLHRIWETDPEGQLIRNDLRNLNLAADQTAPIRHVYLDIYLPNGLLLPIQCPAQRTLALLKQDVFIQAKKYPLNDQLSSISNYIFATIGLDGAHVDLYDEQKTVSSIQFLFLPLLILIEPHGNKIEKELNQNIGFVMGITLRELEHSLNEELQQCRLKLFQTCLEAEAQRGTYSFCHYAFPEEPLIHSTTSATFRRKRYDEVSELDLATQQFPEQPEEIERRAMEKLRQKIQFSDAYVEIWYEKYSVCIRNVLEMTVEGVINAALRELRTLYGQEITQQPSDLILQIAGRRVFVTRRGVPLTQFNYIRSCFENYRIPRLIIRQKKLVFNDYPPPPKIFEPSYVRKERHNEYIRNESIAKNENKTNTTTAQTQRQTKLFWDLDENMKIRIHSISNVTVHDVTDRFFIRVAVAVGRHVLDLKESPTITPSNPRWTQETFIEFDVYLKDLPESAQLCFSLITLHNSSILDNSKANAGSGGKQRGGAQTNSKIEQQQIQPVGWANIRVFDWRSNLIQGKQTLHFRPFEKEEIRLNSQSSTTPDPLQFIHFENYLGLIESSSTATSRYPRLEIEMPEYFGSSTIIQYPSDEIIRRYIGWLKQQKRLMKTTESQDEDLDEEEEMMESDEYGGGERKMQMKLFPGHPDLERLLQLRRCLDSAQLTEDDQCFLWRMRHKILHLFPQMLPVLADCALISRDRETTSEFYHLLSGWPQLQVDTAIELLDGRYVDGRLRAMAVQHLDTALDDDQLQLYLLILIQAIRFEPHAFSPLLRMLLARSLMDYRVGHTLFWLLRAELAHLSAINPANSTTSPLFLRLALLLEAYCRGNCAHLESMIKQVEMISTLTTLSVQIRNCGNKEAANKKLQQELLARKDQLQNMISPVNATDRLGELIIEECKVLSSAKQPLLLTWRNPEILAELSDPIYQLIFKCGDDMRQDMLSLHVMRIMDAKWKSQLQQDYCMTLYEVLPMGKNIGLIHVVPNCQTLFQIQCETKRAATLNMDVALLNKYIYKKCCESDSKKYLECVDRFTFSLAGYCVATYILGIKDRHQDNIMLAKDGRIFHIDFGHFLGHTKRKLGINRERTNFILTDHFLYVISRGKSNVRQTYEYTSFREECIKGFLVLHNQARFFITLFRMMCCMGLPELNCQENVDFLRQSLMYEKTGKDEARLAFEQIFEEVVKGDWSVQLNWFFHSVRHM